MEASANPKSKIQNLKSEPSIFRLLLEEVRRGEVLLRAPGLAYSSLASLVPILAIILAVLSTPAFKTAQEEVFDKVSSVLVISSNKDTGWITDDDDNDTQDRWKERFRENIKPLAEKMGAVSGIGALALMVTAYLLFRTIEQAFNAIWRVTSRRPFFTRLSITTSIVVWAPAILAISVSLTNYFQNWHFLASYVLPTLFTTLAFTGFYMVMPYARVRVDCALIGAVVAAVVWEIGKMLFFLYTTRIVDYSRIYGTLGLLPMLMLWVYVNWVIILAGASIAYCLQHREALAIEWRRRQAEKNKILNEALDEGAIPSPTLVLASAIAMARAFKTPCPEGVRVSRVASMLEVEPGQARRAMERLAESGFVARVACEAKGLDGNASQQDPAFLPARDIAGCDVTSLLSAAYNENGANANESQAWTRARELAAAFAKAGSNGQFSKMTLAELADESRKLEMA
jgi:membrane protein